MVKESWEGKMLEEMSQSTPRVFASQTALEQLAITGVDLQTRLDAVQLLLLKRGSDDGKTES